MDRSEIAAIHPDAVAIDLSLIRGSGFDVLEALSINHEDGEPLCVVLTNSVGQADRAAAKEVGATHFFDKATQINEFLAVIASLAPRIGSERQAARSA